MVEEVNDNRVRDRCDNKGVEEGLTNTQFRFSLNTDEVNEAKSKCL